MHENSIFMGIKFPAANESNPDGFWEDIDFYNLNTQFVSGKMDFSEFIKNVWQVIISRKMMAIPWGFKESRMGHLIGLYVGFFDNPKIIWCRRNPELVIKSMMKWYCWPEERATHIWRTREKTIERVTSGKDVLEIAFGSERISDEDIWKQIKEKWNL